MASKKSQKYWEEREAEALKHYITEEEEFKKEIDKIYRDMLDSVQNEIYSFYGRYATKEGISMAEAKKRVSQADIKALERKAKQYVKDAAKDRRANFGKTNTEGYYFSDEANEEMRLYNLTMKVNRLEMLKANIGLELIDGHSKLKKFMGDILQGRTEAELKRQAGILGKTIQNNAQAARVIVNASFHNATFSERIWMYNDAMKADLSRMISTALIQGKNPRVFAKELEKYYIGEEKLKNGKKGAKYRAESLLITELARVQTEAQKESYIRNGFEEYTFHANSGCCDICDALNGKHFKVKDMMPGKNAPPMHTRCRCSTSAYEDSADYEAWLDAISGSGEPIPWDVTKTKGFERGYALGAAVQGIQKKTVKLPESSTVTVENSSESSTIKLSNEDVRKLYIEKVSQIKDNIDSSLPIEEQAKQAFEARNEIRTEARKMMADEETRKRLDQERPNKTFEELVESKMKRKNMTREEAIRDVYDTATKTNEAVNRELGLGGE